mmetsp:Transcript_32002/g.89159  ORF Transcript_32002/g.89159 Transcript_32002/m.89159 type:complete len:222 (+) Transcript_32002:163-828(+)
MRVAAFMTPATDVYTLTAKDSIQQAMDLMLEHHIGAIVILATDTSARSLPIGIITKTDLIQAYRNQIPSDWPLQEILRPDCCYDASTMPTTCTHTMHRDQAARILEKNHNHHAIVLDSHTNNFAGLISAWDIVSECAKDDRAWPWIRSEDGRFHKPNNNNNDGGDGDFGDDENDDDDLLLLPANGAEQEEERDKQRHGGRRRHGHAFSDTFERYLRDAMPA